jgi:hypothetical protein
MRSKAWPSEDSAKPTSGEALGRADVAGLEAGIGFGRYSFGMQYSKYFSNVIIFCGKLNMNLKIFFH